MDIQQSKTLEEVLHFGDSLHLFSINIFKISMEIADLIITPTRYSKFFLIESMHVVKAPVLALSNGIDLEAYTYKQRKCRCF